jgi:hypothetical protein
MKDQLITFETAKLAKKKGCKSDLGLAPLAQDFTQSLLQKWLREKHNIHIICFYRASTKSYSINITHTNLTLTEYTAEFKNSHKINIDILYNTFEEALEAGLQQALNLIP